MTLLMDTINLQLMLFLLIATGYVAAKIDLIDPRTKTKISDLLIGIILPCNIMHPFLEGMEVSSELVTNCVFALIFSLILQVAARLLFPLVFRKYPKNLANPMVYGMVCSNSGFIGLPVAENLYGTLGVLYTSMFQIPQRIMMWTAGLALFTTVSKKDALKKVVTHPCIIAVCIGLVVMLLNIPLPLCVTDTVTSISKCTTPLSMFMIGAILAEADIRTMFSPLVLYFTFLRLIAFPVLVYLVLLPLHLDTTLLAIAVILNALPAGSTTAILAHKYGCDARFASQITFMSTLFSIFTIPMLRVVLGL